jgi:hypothetical protein
VKRTAGCITGELEIGSQCLQLAKFDSAGIAAHLYGSAPLWRRTFVDAQFRTQNRRA